MSTVMNNGFGFSRFMIQSFSQAAQQSVVKTAELSPKAMSRRSTADDDNDELGSQVEEEHQYQPRSTQLSYEQVAYIAFQAASRLDWRQLRNSTSLWDEKKRLSASSNFAIYMRQSRGIHYVMAVGSVSCSISELRSILRPTTDAKYTAAMTELYGDTFVQGSIVHRSRSSSVSNSSNFPIGSRSSTVVNTGGAWSPHRLVNNNSDASSSANTNTSSGFMAKTATFAKAHVFAKSQQWSFLECYQETPDQHGFTVTMSSLSPFFETPGRARASTKTSGGILRQVEQLQGITAAYSVFADPRHPNGELQITFYSKFAEDCTSFSPLKRHAFKLTLKSHLVTMARATTRLPIIVRRKRLEALSPTDTKAFTLSNPLCICCTATLHLFRAKTRCHSCGYFVCGKCSIEQEVEVENPQAPMVLTRVCQPCIRRVDEAIYERVSVAVDSGDREDVDPLASTQVARVKTSSMADLLDHIFHTGPEGKKQAVMSVIKYVLDDDDKSKHNNKKKRTSSLSSHSPRASYVSPFDDGSFAHTDPKSEKDYLRALQTHLTVNHLTTNHDREDTESFCIYVPTEGEGDFTDTGGSDKSSTSVTLGQTKQFKSHHDYRHVVTSSLSPCCSKLTPRDYPVPTNEAHRSKMARRHHQRLTASAVEDVSSLEIICSIACKELACAVAMVTVVESDLTHVVATNSEVYRNAVVPRAESFCAYAIMSDEPLVAIHPKQDERFRDFEVVQQGLSFYCGFPLTSQDGSVIGTLCCGDFGKKEEVSKAQLDVMTKLAVTASKVMQLRSKDVYKRL